MDRVIIAISELKKENWVIIYQFIKSIVYDENLTLKKEAFLSLKKIAIGVRLNSNLNPDSAIDVYSLYGEDVSCDGIGALTTDTCFSILYQKDNDAEDFAELVPFVLFQHEFGDVVSLGIDIGRLNRQDYFFKCSDFFILFDETKPRLGKRNLYFINGKIADKETGEVKTIRTMSFAGKGEYAPNKYEGKPSRRFLPLMQITNENYKSIFGLTQDSDTKELTLIKKSIGKIRKEMGNRILSGGESQFDQWLEAGYFYSYNSTELRYITTKKIEKIRNTIHIYTNCIFELIQNIIFHGGGKGLIYCVFDKKKNISDSYKDKIPNFVNYDEDMRFLRVGICDFGKLGIVDTYLSKTINNDGVHKSSGMSLIDFFDTNSIATTGLSKLEMRYAARLGIKTFVKTIINNNGYFSVESNKKIDNKRTKETFDTVVNGNVVQLGKLKNVVFPNGTHYEIVVPLIGIDNNVFPLQVEEMKDTHEDGLKNIPIIAQPFPVKELLDIHDSPDKDSQVANIKRISDHILKQWKDSNFRNKEGVIALDLNGETSAKDASVIFKIISCLQLSNSDGFEKVILANVTDEFLDEIFRLIDTLIVDNSSEEIWSRSSAIILISENIQIRIIWGKTKSELDYINQQVHNYKNFFNAPKNNQIREINAEIAEDIKKEAKEFIAPYDFIIFSPNNVSLFEGFVLRWLNKEIISKDIVGFLANHTNTYIGNKIIVKNYYEADMLFQNGFFAEKFAILIAQNIKSKLQTDEQRKKKILLIGYKQYSEFLLKRIRLELQKNHEVYCAIASGDKDILNPDIYSESDEGKDDASEDKDMLTTDIYFNFNIGNTDKHIKDRILQEIDDYSIVTIVPIGSTLSTNDKIIACFKQWHKREKEKNKKNQESKDIEIINRLDNSQFVYNHCIIVVRDKVGAEVSELETEQNWKSVDVDNHVIETQYQNTKKIHYTIQIARRPTEDEDKSNWVKRLNNSISFPLDWKDEGYVNFTENSSINSQNLMGFPQVENSKSLDYIDELSRLYEFKDDIYKGHIDAGGCHHKYYIDTESFVKRNRKTDSFLNWLSELKKVFREEKLDVLITPNAEYESDFINLVNEKVFDRKALIVYLDVKNWRNNIVHKLSFLKRIPQDNVRFHYVDHALHTGATFRETRSYLFSILGYNDVLFESIITIINRLSFAKNKEIVNNIEGNKLFSYVSLHCPNNEGEQECELCKLKKYYKGLKDKTVLDSCMKVIGDNQNKLKLIQKIKLGERYGNKKENYIQIKRNFLRLIMTHEIYHTISPLPDDRDKGWKECKTKIKDNLDALYYALCYDKTVATQQKELGSFIQHINSWYGDIGFLDNAALKSYYEKKLVVDKKIAFLKVISSPPLSQYIVVREYAYKKLLDELHSIIIKAQTQSEEITYDDLKIAKAILKSLSFLKSNALVRKDVIVGIWTILRWVIENQDKERDRIKLFCEFLRQKELELRKELKGLRHTHTLLDELNKIDSKQVKSKINLVIGFREEVEFEMIYRCSKREVVRDFSRDVQFFVKNAIVDDDAKATFLGELLRKGTEMTDFNNVFISETSLCLDNNKSDINNTLFHCFDGVVETGGFREEFINFLVWLFYDNTTIIRKTLGHFAKELKKDVFINGLFYRKGSQNDKLIDIKVFKNNLITAKNAFVNKVESEYYYHSFRPYLTNGDKIDYVEKLIYVTYAQKKLEDLIQRKHKTYIESDTRDLMEVFAAIMGADAAFLTMKKQLEKNDYQLYPVSLYSTMEKVKDNVWNYDKWLLMDNYYTGLIYTYKNLKSPIIPKYNIANSDNNSDMLTEQFGEYLDLKAHSLGIFVIHDRNHSNCVGGDKTSIIATITFLYKNDNPITHSEKLFRLNLQESGRLLLLLKNNIDKYVVDYLVRDKAFDLWEQNFWSVRRFEKVYSNSNHVFNSVFDQLEEFETIKLDLFEGDNNKMKQVEDMIVLSLGKTWYWLTDEMISYLYANIERHQENGKHYLSLDDKDDVTVRKNHSLKDVFSKLFIKMLNAQLQIRWVGQQIVINGVDISEKDSCSKIKIANSDIHCNKGIIQTFIVQCLNNSLRDANEDGGHRCCDIKKVVISVNENSITIKDVVVAGNKPTQDTIRLFEKNKRMIREMNCKRYSCTTLTSLQGFVNYMNKQKDTKVYKCDFEYNKCKDFEVRISFD
jgi:hypothetical protein